MNMENYSIDLSENKSTIGNGSNYFENEDIHWLKVWYVAIPAVLICLCVIAIIINVRILVATRWLRRPVSPTLFISLSLALADAVSATLLAVGVLMNSFLPFGLGYPVPGPVVLLTTEAVRLSCILVTMIHLLLQSCNHYMGILVPFQSRRWLTHNNVTVMVTAIWLFPIIFMFTYFSSFEGQGFQAPGNETFIFIRRQSFRGMYSTLVFIPLIIMFFIYFHISIIVKKHQAGRQRYTRQSRHGKEQESRNAEQQFDRNLKAIWTTLLILLSYMICLMPAILVFSFVCDDCLIILSDIDPTSMVAIASACNVLLVIKPLLNPFIYASRMQEIKAATRRMNDTCRRRFYPFVSTSEQDTIFGSVGDGIPRRSSFISQSSTRRHHYSVTSTHQLGNGYTGRSVRRRPDNVTTDL